MEDLIVTEVGPSVQLWVGMVLPVKVREWGWACTHHTCVCSRDSFPVLTWGKVLHQALWT